MDGLLREIASTRTEPDVGDTSRSDDLIQISSSSRISKQNAPPAISEAFPRPTNDTLSPTASNATILERLRATPSLADLLVILEDIRTNDELNPRLATPTQSGPLLRTLLENTIPNFWPLVAAESTVRKDAEKQKLRRILLEFMGTPAGLGAIVARLRLVLGAPKTSETETSLVEVLKQLLGLLQACLKRDGVLGDLWNQAGGGSAVRAGMLWREVIGLLAGGKVLSLSAEARKKLGPGVDFEEDLWISEGKAYARWLGNSIAVAIVKMDDLDENAFKGLAQLLGKSFSLGYTNEILESLIDFLLFQGTSSLNRLRTLVSFLHAFEKRSFLRSTLRVVSRQNFTESTFRPQAPFEKNWWKKDAEEIGAVGRIILELIQEELGVEDFQQTLLEWLNTDGGVGDSIGIRRAVILAVTGLKRKDLLQDIFQHALSSFADKLWIKHTPTLRQEATTQILLLTAGILHRLSPSFLKSQTQSSLYLNAISNRLGAHSNRARVLGTYVGEAISELVDEEGKKLKFGTVETEMDEAVWWESIVYVEDKLAGDLEALKRKREALQPKTSQVLEISRKSPKPKKTAEKPAAEPKKLMTLVDSDSESEDDDLKPYAAPSDDEADSDSDPTTINRNKPSPPVYIRDLLAYLRTATSYDHHALALTHGAPLILRKSSFGTEVTDALPDLIPAFLSVTDAFDLENFEELRQGALIALVRASPERAAPMMAKLFYEGDLSISQRLGLLSALTLGARALAGYKDGSITREGTGEVGFPSRKLPERLEAVYAVERLEGEGRGGMLRTLAVRASEELAGPRVLQVSKVSRRLELQRTRRFVPEPSSRLAKCVGEAFVFPLMGLWWRYTRDYAPNLPYPLTSTYIKTIFLILHASGPSTSSLPQLTRESLDFLSLFRRPVSTSSDLDILEAVFFGYLTLLEIHNEASDDGKEFVRRFGREVNEAAGWVKGCFEGLGEEGEEGGCKKVAAGVLVRWSEMVEGLDVLRMGWWVE